MSVERKGFPHKRQAIYRVPVEYPRTALKYHSTPEEITLEEGKGVLILQKTGIDGGVDDFQCHVIDPSKGRFLIPADYWSSVYNIGDIPLSGKIGHEFVQDPTRELKAPHLAFKIIQEDGKPALLATQRVVRIYNVNSGGIPDANRVRSLPPLSKR